MTVLGGGFGAAVFGNTGAAASCALSTGAVSSAVGGTEGSSNNEACVNGKNALNLAKSLGENCTTNNTTHTQPNLVTAPTNQAIAQRS